MVGDTVTDQLMAEAAGIAAGALFEQGAKAAAKCMRRAKAPAAIADKGTHMRPRNPFPNTPDVINGRYYSGHALDRMQQRGLFPSVVEDTISQGVATPGRGGTTVHSTSQATVILNSQGGVVTVW